MTEVAIVNNLGTDSKPATSRKRWYIMALAMLLALGLLGGSWLYAHNSQPASDSIGLSSYNSAQNAKLMAGNSASKILLISMNTTNNPSAPLTITGISQYNAQSDRPETAKKDYLLEVVVGDTRVYASYFAIPVVAGESFDQNGTIVRAQDNQTTSLAFRIPRVKDGSAIIVRNSNGDVVLQDTVKNVKVVNNTSDYQAVAGENVQDN